MRSKYILGLLTAGFSLAIAAVGCGSDAEDGTGGSGATTGSGTGAATGSGTMSTTGPGSGGSGGMVEGDGNDSFDEAEDLPINQEVDGATGIDSELATTGDEDFYKFTGTKGQVLEFFVFAQEPDMASFDPTYIDTIITLYDESKQQIAQNDDPLPQSQNDSILATILPADGTYYLRVTECWTVYETCGGTADKDNTTFSLYAFELHDEEDGYVSDKEAGDDETTAEEVDYLANPAGGYYLTEIWGGFADDTDVDVFSFTVPEDAFDATTDLGRPTTRITVPPAGADANGSTVDTGLVWITTAANPTTRLALVDGTKVGTGLQLAAPITFGQPYLLWVQHPNGATPGSNPFFFLGHGNGGSNPVEPTTPHDTALTAAVLTAEDTAAGGQAYFVAGDLAVGTADWFSFENNAATANDVIFGSCSGQRIGSGVRQLKMTVTQVDGTTQLGTGTETDTDPANLGEAGLTFPATETNFLLKVEAGSQDAVVVGSHYSCVVGFTTP